MGQIFQTLAEQGLKDNTLVLIMADHGDMMGSHRMVTKQVCFYEEVSRVPFIWSGPGVARQGTIDRENLVSLIDLMPTLCDYAGLDVPSACRGRSLLPLRSGHHGQGADYVASQWHTEWGFTTSPGRMVRTRRYKYTRYLEQNAEELYDLDTDPFETRTLVDDPAYATVLQEHRDLLERHIAQTGDDFHELSWQADARWRSHRPGFEHHQGPSAPEAAAGP